MRGGTGFNSMFGGEGADTFLFYEGDAHSSLNGIKDYNAGAGDGDVLFFSGASGVNNLILVPNQTGGATASFDITWNSGNTDHYSMLLETASIAIVTRSDSQPPEYHMV